MDEQALSELLECSVCLERLDHTSKVLPCQHTFCRRCLEEIVSTQLELRCPECRTLVTVRVEDLPPNILLVRLLEGLKTQGHALSPKPSCHRKRDTSADSRQQQAARAGLDGPQPCAKALYSYDASEKDDLSFKKGDVVTLRRQIDDNWYQGELNGQIGVFPASYVQVLVPLPQIPQCRALYDFQLDDENEKDCLTFKKDQVITVIRKVDTNWIEGRKGDKIGILPLAFVELNHAAKTLISSKPPSLVLHHGRSNATATTTTTTSSTSTSTSAPPSSSQPPSSPARAAMRQASRMSPHKRHSFTPKSDSPSPPPQAQRHSLELTSGEGNGVPSPPVTTSPLSLAPSPALMSTSMPAMPSSQERPLPSMTASVIENGASGDAAVAKASMTASVNSSAAGPSSASPPTVYMAVYNYRPQKDDEVELRKRDYYTVSEKCQDGWFKGQCLRTGVTGVFPGNYVQVVRQSSMFRPLNPNVLNIRAKVPAPENHLSQHPQPRQAPARSLSDVGSSSSSSSFSPPVPPHIKTSSPVAPPLLPRVARMSASSVSSSSAVTGRSSPLSSHTQSPKSISNTHVPVTITGGKGGRLPESPRSGLSVSGCVEPHHVHIGGGAMGHLSKRSTSPSSGAKLTGDGHARTSSPHGGLMSVHPSMSTSSTITPPNVVMGPSESSTSPLALIAKDKDKKEKKEKEKKGLVKLWPGKGKKSKSSPPETTPAHLTGDSVAHTRSGSFPSERNAPSSPRESSQHRKTASLDSSTSPLPKMRSKTQLRERYRCIVPYPPQTDHELELEMGDIVHVHKRREDGWYKGTQERTSKTGLFPGSFVEKCD